MHVYIFCKLMYLNAMHVNAIFCPSAVKQRGRFLYKEINYLNLLSDDF